MILLSATVCVYVAVVVIKLFFSAGYPLFGRAYVDTILLVIVCHKNSSDFRFLETEELKVAA